MTLASQPVKQQETHVSRKNILLVEDDSGNAESLNLLFEMENSYQVMYFRTGGETLANLDIIKSLSPVLFLLDYTLPRMTALDLYQQLHAT